ncbi:MAG TPA: hypothetical protein VHV51_07495 [Polyangiaceae bacterium]|nr:hypothetical protein [Polyangiaceae bacterium]
MPSSCAPGLPSAAEIASTPRANTNLELLALRFSSGVVAEQAIYDRIVRDVAAIDAQAPELADITYSALADGRTWDLGAGPTVLAEMEQGTYHDWDCLNQTYVVKNISFTMSFNQPLAKLELKGIYDFDKVGAQYGALRGVETVLPETNSGSGSTICLTLDGATWHYVFDRGSGDCPAGCITHVYTHFSTNAAGAVTALGQIMQGSDSPYISPAACTPAIKFDIK